MANKRDYYEVLGVGKTASDTDIKSAYRKLARQYHPDVNKNAGAEGQFKEVQEAYEILSDGSKRQQYDQFGHEAVRQGAGQGPFGGGFEGFSGAEGADFEDIFDVFFGGSRRRGGTQAKAGPRRGEDLRVNLTVKLEEAASGIEKEIELGHLAKCETCTGTGSKKGSAPSSCRTCGGSGQVRHSQRTILGSFTQVTTCPSCGGQGQTISDPCPNCRGRGVEQKRKRVKVQIPGGVDNGSRIRMSGAGNAGPAGGQPGDLYVVVQVEPHRYFQREGDDLVCRVEISYAQAALGDEIEVPTIDGKVSLKIPAGTSPNAVFRIKGKGMPRLQSHGRGDQHVQVLVEVPKNLSGREKELLLELKKIQDAKSGSKSVFDRVKEIIS